MFPLVRVHSECLTGDALGSWRCDCGEQLDAAMREIGREGRVRVIYLRGHEGRGIGCTPSCTRTPSRTTGLDTVDANLRLGFPVDARDYGVAAAILSDLGVRRIRLLSANPDKSARLGDLGIEVTARLPLPVTERAENALYLATKRSRMGHDSARSLPDAWSGVGARSGTRRSRGRAASAAARSVRVACRCRSVRCTIAQLAQSVDGFIAIEDRRRQLRLRRRGPRAPASAAGAGGCRRCWSPDGHR